MIWGGDNAYKYRSDGDLSGNDRLTGDVGNETAHEPKKRRTQASYLFKPFNPLAGVFIRHVATN